MGASLAQHPAIRTWNTLSPGSEVSIEPELIREDAGSLVYRLNAVGQFGTNVIAKRCDQASASLERSIYQTVLARIEVPSLRCYGLIHHEESDFSWLFVEEARGEEYSLSDSVHSRAVATWLGRLHVAAARLAPVEDLPERGPDYSLRRLRAVRSALSNRVDSYDPESKDQAAVIEAIQYCALAESQWNMIEEATACLPRTLVHGDVSAENVRIRSTGAETDVQAFDWGKGGWGIPAVDIARVDVGTYWAAVQDVWPQLTLLDVTLAADCGALFRTLIHDWAHKAPRKLRQLSRRIATGLKSAGLHDEL